jgi:hypothetical protein
LSRLDRNWRFVSNSPQLSPVIETRHFRHFWSKRLILFAKLVSGSAKKPDNDPTFRIKNPTSRWHLPIIVILVARRFR